MKTTEAITVPLTGDELAFLLSGVSYAASEMANTDPLVRILAKIGFADATRQLGDAAGVALGVRLHATFREHFGEHFAIHPLTREAAEAHGPGDGPIIPDSPAPDTAPDTSPINKEVA